MSFIGSAKEFFGLGVQDVNEADDAYYYDDERRYAAADTGYGRGDRIDREVAERDTRAYGSTRVHTPAVLTVTPRNYNDAREIGEPFRDGDAVIMDLTDLDAADAKRLVDFAAGLCFALRGKMHNLSRNIDTDRRVFAIAPENAGIAPLELERAAHLR
ncbi:cell division protein SepF [Corynebacterium qintianiae]|uniref:Cell division protein SepF n=1 Tax=Corynebacterium qintianiae TaxID=2709392 RepID=A0A7T0PD81_9CORY|nr:cell division protein SepF [Corynebacterium qintianiae]QPK82678.1 cell division protein SepF [Corynebacterium qintianiae]